MLSERGGKKKRRTKGWRQRRRRGKEEKERDKKGGWKGQQGIGQCKLLSIVRNGASALLVSNWKIALIFWFPFQGMLHGQGPKKTGGMGRKLKFLFFNFFL